MHSDLFGYVLRTFAVQLSIDIESSVNVMSCIRLLDSSRGVGSLSIEKSEARVESMLPSTSSSFLKCNRTWTSMTRKFVENTR